SNKCVWGPSTNAFKMGLKFMAQLYQEKLLDQQFAKPGFTIAKWTAQIMANKVGMITSYADFVDLGFDVADKFVMMPPVKAPGYTPTWTFLANRKFSPNQMVITKNNKYPLETVKWADFFWSEEGQKYAQMGPEKFNDKNVRWKNNTDGTWTDLGATNRPSTFKDMTTWMGTITPGYMLPIVYHQSVADKQTKKKTSDMTREELIGLGLETDIKRCYEPYKPQYALPYLIFNDDQALKVSNSFNSLNMGYSLALTSYIYGTKSVDADWDNYITSLKNRGLDAFVKIYQDAYDAYNKK
ncbi:MAG: type 2 periplasmic-binding domain-containing protein, partial [Saccharofermentanales bacterium]